MFRVSVDLGDHFVVHPYKGKEELCTFNMQWYTVNISIPKEILYQEWDQSKTKTKKGEYYTL